MFVFMGASHTQVTGETSIQYQT